MPLPHHGRQSLPSPLGMDASRFGREFQHGRDFVEGHPLKMPQDKHFPLAPRQFVEKFDDQGLCFRRRRWPRSVLTQRQLGNGSLVSPAKRRLSAQEPAPLYDDSANPWPPFVRVLQLGRSGVCREERLLHGVLGVGPAPQQPVGQTEQPVACGRRGLPGVVRFAHTDVRPFVRHVHARVPPPRPAPPASYTLQMRDPAEAFTENPRIQVPFPQSLVPCPPPRVASNREI